MLLTNQRERENDPRHYGGLQYKFLTTTSQHFQSCYRSPSPHFLISKSNTFNVLFTVQSFLSIHWTQSINIFLLGTKHNSSITFSHACPSPSPSPDPTSPMWTTQSSKRPCPSTSWTRQSPNREGEDESNVGRLWPHQEFTPWFRICNSFGIWNHAWMQWQRQRQKGRRNKVG